MLRVTLIAVDRLRDRFYADACAEYIKRLGTDVRLTVSEVRPAQLPQDPSQKEIAAALDAEAELILSKIPAGARVYAMCVEGKEMTSAELAREISGAAVNGFGTLAFIIGSSYGLSDRVKQRADVRLSMSRMTFAHQLARVMLLEQLYRAVSITRGGKYDK